MTKEELAEFKGSMLALFDRLMSEPLKPDEHTIFITREQYEGWFGEPPPDELTEEQKAAVFEKYWGF